MAANIFGNRFYGSRVDIWHRIGYHTEEDHTAQEAFEIMGEYYFIKRPVTVELNGKQVEVGDYAIVRSATNDDPQEVNLGYVSKEYTIIQPSRICELFDDGVGLPVKTIGALGKGEKLFVSWPITPFEVNGHEIKTNGLISVGYTGKDSASLFTTVTDVVCQNTLNIAVSRSINEQTEENGRLFRGRHNSKNLERDLALWLEYATHFADQKVSEVAQIFNDMVKVTLDSKEDVYSLLFNIYPDPKKPSKNMPELIYKEQDAKYIAKSNEQRENRDLVYQLFSGAGTGIEDNSVFSLLSACTEKTSWTGTVKKPIESSILFGNRAKEAENAFGVLMDYTYSK